MGTNLMDVPMKLLMPSSFDNVKEIAFKTIPSVSKGEIKTILQSMYGLEIAKVRTLNMQGKKKRSGGRLVSRPNYKKAYITLKNPISIAPDLDVAQAVAKEITRNKQSNSISPEKGDVSSESLAVGTLGHQ